MSLKEFNHQFNHISSGEAIFTAENEAHLHCLLKETILNIEPNVYVNEVQELPIMLANLHQVIKKCDQKSGPFGKSVELIENIIVALKGEQDILKRMPILPVLSDILLNSSRTEYTLKLIQDVTFVVTIKTCQPFVDQLIQFCVKTLLCDDSIEHGNKLQHLALSVLINLCSKNSTSLSILEQQINLVDFQKKIPLKTYGVLACKMNLVLDESGNILRDTDVRNFLNFLTKELHRIPSLDEKSLKHLVEFIRDITENTNTKHILKGYDFCTGIQAAIMTLENSTDNITLHVNSLFEIIKIVTASKNDSLKNLNITVIDFSIKRLKHLEYRVQALETLATTFNHDSKIATSNFELEGLQENLKSIIHSNDRHHTVMAPLFKLLTILARNYKINLLTVQVVDSIFGPLMKTENPKNFNYFKSPIGEITMYLECLTTLSTLMEYNIFETKPNLFQTNQIQFLVAMSIKHGNTDQCCLALSLMDRLQKRNISEIISSKTNDNKIIDSYQFLQNNQCDGSLGQNLSKELGKERIQNIFFNVEKACLNQKIEEPASDFIKLYTNEIALLKQQIEILSKKYEVAGNEINLISGQNMQLQITSMKWSELAQNLQKSNETLMNDIEKLNAIVTTLKSNLKSTLCQNDKALQKLSQEKNAASRKNKEMEEKVQSLEDELKDTEDMRQTILSLMSKRKKTSGKDTV